MKPYEEVCFPSGILRWIREGDEYVCRLTEDQINEIKEIHEEPWVKTYSGGKPNYTQPIEREPYPENFIDALRFDAAQSEPVIQARKEGDLIVADLPQVPRGSGGITKDEQPEPKPVAWCIVENGRIHGLVKTKPAVMNAEKWQPLYTAPPQREWQGLTDEEYEAMAEQYVTNCYFDTLKYAKAIEAKLKDNNYDND